MKHLNKGLILLILIFFQVGCTDNDDSNDVPSGVVVQNFIWKGLNQFYLWQSDVPELADEKAYNYQEFYDYLATKGTAEDCFQSLLNKPISLFPTGSIDRFSVLVDDYEYLENLLNAKTTTSGLKIGLRVKPNSTVVYGYVKYVIPNSDASTKDIKRGDVFYVVNGTNLDTSNYSTLLGASSFTLSMATYNGGNITPNGKTVSLTKTFVEENPIFLKKVFTYGDKKIGYLVYNSFTASYDSQLNDVFGEFKAQGVNNLIIDLRYNPGGSIKTAVYLASMITGQFNDQIFCNLQWNSKVQSYYEKNYPSYLYEKFTNTMVYNKTNIAINSLNLSKVNILMTDNTASASELLINCLDPYITVNRFGTKTTGKNVGSITLYDSPDFSKNGVNTSHKYAMQPLVIKLSNSKKFSGYENGLTPSKSISENLDYMDVLGSESEPLLSAALLDVKGKGVQMPDNQIIRDLPFENHKFEKNMYIETPKNFKLIK